MDFFDALPSYSNELYCHKKMKNRRGQLPGGVERWCSLFLEGLDEWSYDAIHDALIGLAERNGLKNGRIMWPVRTALLGQGGHPPAGLWKFAIFSAGTRPCATSAGMEQLGG